MPVQHRVFILCLFAVLGLGAAEAAAQEQSSRLYLAGYMGLNTLSSSNFTHPGGNGEIDLDNGMTYAGALGLRITPQLRLEAEINYQSSDAKNMALNTGAEGRTGGGVKTWLYMLNAYYDFNMDWKKVTPFVSGGLGLAVVDGEVRDAPAGLPDASETTYDIAWSLGGGLRYKMKPNMSLMGAYRYIGSTEIGIDDYSLDYSSHEFRLGLTYDIPAKLIKNN